MKYSKTAAFLSVALLCLAGCDNPRDVAVVDLVRVASELKLDEQVVSQAQTRRQQLQQVTAQVEGKLQEEKAKIGDSPSDQDLTRFNQLKAQAEQQLRIQRMRIMQMDGVANQQMLAQVKSDAKSYVRQIAIDRGFTVVLAIGDYMIIAQPTADITDQVIEKMRKGAEAMKQASPASGDDAPAAAPTTAPAE